MTIVETRTVINLTRQTIDHSPSQETQISKCHVSEGIQLRPFNIES